MKKDDGHTYMISPFVIWNETLLKELLATSTRPDNVALPAKEEPEFKIPSKRSSAMTEGVL